MKDSKTRYFLAVTFIALACVSAILIGERQKNAEALKFYASAQELCAYANKVPQFLKLDFSEGDTDFAICVDKISKEPVLEWYDFKG